MIKRYDIDQDMGEHPMEDGDWCKECDVKVLENEIKILRIALSSYALPSEWSGTPHKLLFNSTYRDAHGFDIAIEALMKTAN